MDGFSAVASTVGFIDVLWRVGQYLKDLKGGTERIKDDIDGLHDEIESLIAADNAIEKFRTTVKAGASESQISRPPIANELWLKVEQNRESCKRVVLQLEEKLKSIQGEDPSTKSSLRGEIKRALSSSADVERGQSRSTNPTDPTPAKVKQQSPGTLHGLKQTLRMQSASSELAKIHSSLVQYQHALLALLASLNM